MATAVIHAFSAINGKINSCSTFNPTNFTQPYSYFDDNDSPDIVNLKEVQFEDERTNGIVTKERTYQLFDDKTKIPLPIDILNEAERISQQMTRAVHNRKNRRKRRQFACIYFACNALMIEVFSAQGIADAIGLPHEEISPAITDFSPLRSGYLPNKRITTTMHPSTRIAADYAKNLDFTDADIEHTKMIINEALIANPKIKARKPVTIAIGGIAAYVYLGNKNISLKQLNEISIVSESTIKITRDEILAAYNS